MVEKLTARQQALMKKFRKERGYWAPLWDRLLRWDPDFFENYTKFSGHVFHNGPLPRKVKELILIAVDCTTTHLYEPGLRVHIRNALKAGATREELLEVMELASFVGIHSCTFGVPILEEELSKFNLSGKT